MEHPPTRQRGLARVAKRALDCAVAGATLTATAPIMAAAAVAIRATMGGPVLFRQKRPGLHGQAFELWKFRTMNDARDAAGNLRPDSERLTALGKFLRASSVDELPQLINVLRGDMSLVGPRPLLMQYLERYTAEQARRHDVIPGMTGWTQVHGRNDLSWEEKFELDVWYVDNWSLMLDLAILIRTVGAVVAPKGVSKRGHATMPEYMGPGRSEPGDARHSYPAPEPAVSDSMGSD